MNTPPLPSSATHAKIFEFVRAMLGTDRGREDDDHPLPPGPWDPVIRAALGSLGMHAIGDGPLHIDALGGEVALNPQPLPPRQAFLVALAPSCYRRSPARWRVWASSREKSSCMATSAAYATSSAAPASGCAGHSPALARTGSHESSMASTWW